MKKKLLIAMGIGAGALLWYKMKKPNMMEDMKKSIKKTAENIADFTD